MVRRGRRLHRSRGANCHKLNGLPQACGPACAARASPRLSPELAPGQRRRRRRLDPESFSRAFAKLCNRAGLGHWHPHELRHSGASLMLAQGTPLHVVSEILGHASITITKDVYGHLVEGIGGLSLRP